MHTEGISGCTEVRRAQPRNWGGCFLLCVCAAGLTCGLLACDKKAAESARPAATGTDAARASVPAANAPSETYSVRGRIIELPEPGKPQREFKVHHEAIDGFVGADGKVVGMSAMTMAFPPGPGVTLSGLAIGDIVSLTFDVRRSNGRFDWHATRIEKLAADTQLEFRKSRKPGA